MTQITAFLDRGGPALWVIAALSVITLALILWKVWQFLLLGVWRTAAAERAVGMYRSGDVTGAVDAVAGRKGLRSTVVAAALDAVQTKTDEDAKEEVSRVARAMLKETSSGLRALDLITTIAPLIGLLGTVMGMIDAFQALQDTGARADPAALAGGIWEALLTTAAGMAVAIPASIALSWCDSVVDRVAHDFDDLATRIFAKS